MTNATDALRALLQEAHACALSHLGLLVVNNMTDGVEETKALIGQLEQALATPAGSASGEDAKDAKVEQVQRWSAEVQHGTLGSATRHYADPHGSWVHHDDYAALQAEVARLREDATRYRWLRDDPPVTLCVRQRHDEKRDLFYQYTDGSQLDAAIDAAMGSANGQG